MTGVNSPKSGKRLPVYVEEKDMHLLLDHVEFPDNWKGKTDRLLIRMFYNTGVRLTELVSLKTASLIPEARTMRVIGKGNKERMIPLSARSVEEIRLYQDQKQSILKSGTPKIRRKPVCKRAGQGYLC